MSRVETALLPQPCRPALVVVTLVLTSSPAPPPALLSLPSSSSSYPAYFLVRSCDSQMYFNSWRKLATSITVLRKSSVTGTRR